MRPWSRVQAIGASGHGDARAPATIAPAMHRRLELWTLGLFLAGFCTYRAVTQSITYDEACTYIQFVRGSWWNAVTQYSANNHVLFTLLAKLSTDTLGVTELTLRLPTLLGAGLYVTSAFALCRRLAEDRIVAGLASAALTLNPFVLDFLVAARGYGLALGFLLMALVLLARALERSDVGRNAWWLAGTSVALGLSVSANLAFLFPGVAVVCATAAIAPCFRAGRRAIAWLVIPGAVLAAATLTLPLSHARPELFFYGATSLGEGVTSLVTASLHYHDTRLPGMTSNASDVVVAAVGYAAVNVAALWLGRSLTRYWRALRHPGATDVPPALTVLLTAATLCAPLLAVAAHLVCGVAYPQERTALYLIPMCTLALVGSRRGARRMMIKRAALAIVVALYAAQLDWTHFRTWWFDASSRQLFALARTARQHDHCPGSLAASWLYEPSLRFYATILTSEECPLDVVHAWQPGMRGYDVYVLTPDDDAAMITPLDVIHVDRLSGAAVAVERLPDAQLARRKPSAPRGLDGHGDDNTWGRSLILTRGKAPARQRGCRTL
jgi:hypothetical protein